VIQTITTVGYGDISAYTIDERILSLILMLFGVVFYSFVIGTLSSVITQMDSRNNKLQTKLSAISSYAKHSKLPKDLTNRLRKYIM
jgi:hypothetical protein